MALIELSKGSNLAAIEARNILRILGIDSKHWVCDAILDEVYGNQSHGLLNNKDYAYHTFNLTKKANLSQVQPSTSQLSAKVGGMEAVNLSSNLLTEAPIADGVNVDNMLNLNNNINNNSIENLPLLNNNSNNLPNRSTDSIGDPIPISTSPMDHMEGAAATNTLNNNPSSTPSPMVVGIPMVGKYGTLRSLAKDFNIEAKEYFPVDFLHLDSTILDYISSVLDIKYLSCRWHSHLLSAHFTTILSDLKISDEWVGARWEIVDLSRIERVFLLLERGHTPSKVRIVGIQGVWLYIILY